MPDLARMRTERYRRLQDQLDAQGVDGLVLLGSSAVAYATGAGRARSGRRPCCAVPDGRRCGQGRLGAARVHPLRRRASRRPARRPSARAALPGHRRRHRAVREGPRRPLRTGRAHRDRPSDTSDPAGPAGPRLGRRCRCGRRGEAHQDTGRGGLYPSLATAQRTRDGRRARRSCGPVSARSI